MPSQPLFDYSNVDLDQALFDLEDIKSINPHRFDFIQIDHIAHFEEEPLRAVAIRDIREDEFWVRGHFPGNPLFPGVLMVEAAAQAASICFQKKLGQFDDKIFGFGGLENVRFRGAVKPGDRVVLLVSSVAARMRRAVFDMQAWVGDRLVCEGQVIGVTIKVQK